MTDLARARTHERQSYTQRSDTRLLHLPYHKNAEMMGPLRSSDAIWPRSDPATTLKQKYGRDLVFWGGGVDTQQVLPFGAPDEVREQVLQRCEAFSHDGGFVFNTVHNIQARTPVDNIIAMVQSVEKFRVT